MPYTPVSAYYIVFPEGSVYLGGRMMKKEPNDRMGGRKCIRGAAFSLMLQVMRNWGSERLSDSANVTQLTSVRTKL